MVEPIMFFGLGFLAASLIGLIIVPFVHGRAVRLTVRIRSILHRRSRDVVRTPTVADMRYSLHQRRRDASDLPRLQIASVSTGRGVQRACR